MSWRRVVATGLHTAEDRFDRFRFGLKRRFGLLDPFEVLPYRGHGTPHELFLKGRDLEEAGIRRPDQDDTVLENLRNMARHFASDEVAGARVRASFGETRVEAVANEEDFFHARLALPEPLTDPTRSTPSSWS